MKVESQFSVNFTMEDTSPWSVTGPLNEVDEHMNVSGYELPDITLESSTSSSDSDVLTVPVRSLELQVDHERITYNFMIAGEGTDFSINVSNNNQQHNKQPAAPARVRQKWKNNGPNEFQQTQSALLKKAEERGAEEEES